LPRKLPQPASPPVPQKTSTLLRLLPILALPLLVFIAHAPGINGAFSWDDNEYLLQNDAVQHWNTFFDLWKPGNTALYCPMTTSSLWLDNRFWGIQPRGPHGIRGQGYHATNILLHAASCVLLFLIFQKLKLPGGTVSAWFAAALFAVHPVTVESVAWIAERKNTLCCFFLFSSALFAFRTFAIFPDAPPRRRDYPLALILFLTATLSKIAVSFFPAAIVILILWRRRRISRREILKFVPFVVIVLIFGFISVHWEHAQGGTVGPDYDFSPLQRILIASNAFWFQLGKIFWPYPNLAAYPRFPIDPGSSVLPAWLFIAPAAFLIFIAALWALRKKTGPGPLVAILLYIAALFPTLGFVTFYTMVFTFVADHFQYLALPFIFILLSESIALAARKIMARSSPQAQGQVRHIIRLALGTAAAALLFAFGAIAFGASHLYTDRAFLWEFTLQYNPNCWAAINNYCFAQIQDHTDFQQFPLIDALLQKSLALRPNQIDAYLAKKTMYELEGMPEQAANMQLEMIRHASPFQLAQFEVQKRRDWVAAWDKIPQSDEFRRARECRQNAHWQQALDLYQADLKKNPGNDYARVGIGICRQYGFNDLAAALQIYQEIVTHRPDFADAWLFLGFAQRQAGHEPEARAALEKARQYGDGQLLTRYDDLLQAQP
jgi:protein O-mannosyl-transferase